MAGRRKIISVLSGFGMNVNCMIGLGIFTAPGIVWKTLNSPLAAIILWIAGGIISIAAAFSYTELGASIERSGGEVVYFRYFGKVYLKNQKWSQLSIFVSYLFSFLIIVVIIPGKISTELQVAAQYFVYAVSNDPSGLKSNVGWEDGWSTLLLKLIAIITLAIITGYHIPSSRVANNINQTFAGIKLVILAIIAMVGLVKLLSVKLPSVIKEHSNIWSSIGFDDTKGIKAYSSAFVSIMFSYDGWNNLNYSLGEFINPENNLAFSNLSSVIIVTIYYLLVNIAFMSVVPKELIFDNDKAVVAHFFNELLGEKAGQISSLIVTLSAIGTASSLVFSGSRVIAYAAQRDYIPFFSDEFKWDFKEKSPKAALIVQFMWSSLLIILIKDGISSDFYGSFSNFSWDSALVIYILTGCLLLYLRYTSKTEKFRLYEKDYSILILLFIIGRVWGLFVFHHFDVICPENTSNCEEYMKNEEIKRFAPLITGTVFIAISTICYFVIYRLRKNDDDYDNDSDDSDDSGDSGDDDDDDDDMNKKDK